MALQIVRDVCTACGDCEPVCPTNSIKPFKGVYAIEAETAPSAKASSTSRSASTPAWKTTASSPPEPNESCTGQIHPPRADIRLSGRIHSPRSDIWTSGRTQSPPRTQGRRRQEVTTHDPRSHLRRDRSAHRTRRPCAAGHRPGTPAARAQRRGRPAAHRRQARRSDGQDTQGRGRRRVGRHRRRAAETSAGVAQGSGYR